MPSSFFRSSAIAAGLLFLNPALPNVAFAQTKKAATKKGQPAAAAKDAPAATTGTAKAAPAADAKKKERLGPAKFAATTPKLDDSKKEALTDKKRDESIDQLKKIIPKFEDGNEQKADLLFQLSELYWEKSQYLYRKEMKKQDDDYAAYEAAVNKGEKRAEPKQDHRESELFRSETMRLYETILRDYPSYQRKDEVLFSLGYNQYEIGKKDAGVKRYEELIKNYPTSRFVGDTYVQLGNHWFENENLAKAEENFKKAYQSKDPKISSYALYKLGWCDLNAGRLEEGLKKLQNVVAFADTNGKSFTDLKNEALGDMVRFYVQLDRVEEAIAYFKAKAPKKRQTRLISRMSDGLAEAGHHDSAIKGYRYLINEAPMGAAAPEYQQAVVKSYEGLRQREQVKAEIKKLVELYRPGSAWWKANDAEKGTIRNAFNVTEEAMRTMVTEYHQEAQKTKQVETYKLARDIYKQYVDAFATSEDEAFVADQAFNLRFYYAEILWTLEDWANAATQYDSVVTFKIPARDTAKESSNESYRKSAAYAAILAYDKLTKIDRGQLGKSELKDGQIVDEKKKKGTVEKKQQIKRVALTAEQLQEKPLSKNEGALIAACDRYNSLYPNNSDEIDVRYQAAVTYFDKNHFVDAAKRFGEIILKWPEEKRSQDAADLTMSVLEDKNEWLELNKLSRAFLANKKLSKPGTEFTKRAIGVVEGSQYKWVDEVVYRKEKNPAKAAEEYLKFVAEFPKSDNADRALTFSMVIFQEANQLDRGIDSGERVLKEYPGSVFELKVRYTLAVFYEKIADFQKSAEMYEAFVDTYDRLKDPKKYAEDQKKLAAKDGKGSAKAPAKVAAKAPAKGAKADATKAPERKVNPEELKAQLADADKWVADSQYNAALWWEGVGKIDRATAAYTAYITRFKDKSDVPDISWHLAELLEQQGKSADAVKAYETWSTTYAKDTRVKPVKHYLAKSKQYALQQKLKSSRDVEKLQDELTRGFAKLSAEDKKDIAVLNPYAEARFRNLDGSWKQFTDIKFTKVATIKKDFGAKQKKIQEVEKQFADVLAVGSGEWGIAALTRIGLAYADFAQNIMKSPDPKNLDEDQVEMYRGELENLAFPLEEKAFEALEKALAKAYELNVYNDWTIAAQDKINEYRKGYYAEAKTVGYQGAEFFATAPVEKKAGLAAAATAEEKKAPPAPAPTPEKKKAEPTKGDVSAATDEG